MGTKKLTAIPTVSLCEPDVAYAAVWPIGSDINIFAHFVTQILGHLGFEPRTKGLWVRQKLDPTIIYKVSNG